MNDQFWNSIPGGNETRLALEKEIRSDNYGFGPGQWNLTGLLNPKAPDTRKRLFALQIVNGDTPSGGKVEQLVDDEGQPLKFKLKVLTRQACYIPDDIGIRTIPAYDEKPKKGDVVLIKRDIKTRNGKPLTPNERDFLEANGEFSHDMTRAVVDSDGCITVSFNSAVQLLQQWGERISSPSQFDRGSKMRILNWRFAEVDKNGKTRRRQKEEEQPAIEE